MHPPGQRAGVGSAPKVAEHLLCLRLAARLRYISPCRIIEAARSTVSFIRETLPRKRGTASRQLARVTCTDAVDR
jgi:hypothetical protein